MKTYTIRYAADELHTTQSTLRRTLRNYGFCKKNNMAKEKYADAGLFINTEHINNWCSQNKKKGKPLTLMTQTGINCLRPIISLQKKLANKNRAIQKRKKPKNETDEIINQKNWQNLLAIPWTKNNEINISKI